MKKVIFSTLVLAATLFACNNSNQSADQSATSGTDSTKTESTAPVDSPAVAPTTEDGSATMPAQVFEESTGKPVSGAKVDATLDGRSAESAVTDAKGMYTLKNLTTGSTYNYTVTKDGYSSQQKSAVYEGDNSLPGFALNTKK